MLPLPPLRWGFPICQIAFIAKKSALSVLSARETEKKIGIQIPCAKLTGKRARPKKPEGKMIKSMRLQFNTLPSCPSSRAVENGVATQSFLTN